MFIGNDRDLTGPGVEFSRNRQTGGLDLIQKHRND